MKRMLSILALALAALALVGCPQPEGPAPSADVALEVLSVSGASDLNPAFNPTVTAYTVNAEWDTTTVSVFAVAADTKASVAVNATKAKLVSVPLNAAGTPTVITVTVTAENASTGTYTITVNRALPNTNTDLASLTVSSGKLYPSFNVLTKAYGLGVPASTTVTVSASAMAPTTRVFINGLEANTRVVSAPSTVTIETVAQDGTTKGTYTVEVTAAPATVAVSFMVVETVNGSLLPASVLKVFDSSYTQVGSDIAVTNGLATVNLAPNATYNFLLEQPTYAQSMVQDYYVNAVGVNKITIVQQKLGMVTKPAVAPMIMDVSVARKDDLSGATALVPGDILGTEGTTYLLVTIAAPSAVEPTAWSGFGAKIDFDQVPSILNGVGGILLADPAWNAGMGAWVSTFLFDLSDKDYVDGEHDLVMVGYDVANNRIEKHIPVMLSSTGGAAADISAAVFTGITVNMHSFPVSRGWFGKEPGVSIMALNPFEGHDISYRAHVSFRFTDGAATPANVPIRGFDLYRKASTDPEGAWTKVGGQMYGALSTGSGGTHSCFDADSGLSADGVYQYKVVAYTDATKRKESAVASAKVYKPYKASLDLPVHRSEVAVDSATYEGPSFQFLISDVSLWDVAESDYFYFMLEMHEKDGPYTYIGRFRYNFASSKFQFRYGNSYYNFEDIYGDNPTDPAYDPLAFGNSNDDYITWHAGSGAINIPAFVTFLDEPNYATGSGVAYKAGVTYEWDIVGEIKGVTAASATPAWFQKAYTGGLSKSYADGYNEGSNTSNGRFEFVAVQP